MLMIIFGAGASYDSVAHVPEVENGSEDSRPPLANQLFDTRFADTITYFPQLNGIITNLRFRPDNESIEQTLQRIQSEGEVNEARIRQLAAIRCYLQNMLWECEAKWRERHRGVNNYTALLDQIEHWRVQTKEKICLVTFNYDRMLEEALISLGVTTNKLEDYVKDERYTLIKIHGSVNWARELEGDIPTFSNSNPWTMTSELIDFAPRLKLSTRYRIIENRPTPSVPDAILFPALAIPLEQKNDFECPIEHLNVFKSIIPEVDKLITIGWRGKELHFLSLLAENLQNEIHGIAISGNNEFSNETIRNICSVGIKCNFTPHHGGFTNLITSLAISSFLTQQIR
jgi:hypothetical protein